MSTDIIAQQNTVKTFENEFRDSYQKLMDAIDSLCNIGDNQVSTQNDVNSLKIDAGIIKSDVHDVQQELERMGNNLDASDLNIAQLEHEQIRLMKVIDTHAININGLGGAKVTSPSTGGPRWSIKELMETDKYPLLKATPDKNAHYSQILKGLKDVTLKDDKILSIENFWNDSRMIRVA